MSVRVRLVQQMSGNRGDGTPWPAVGEVIEVGEAEAEQLCRVGDSHSKPIAERVEEPEPAPEKPKAPSAPPKTASVAAQQPKTGPASRTTAAPSGKK